MTGEDRPMKEPDVHDLEPPGTAHGTFQRLTYGMTYEAKVRPEDDRKIAVSYGIDSTDHKWFVRMSFNDPDMADDIFKTSEQIHALMWFGHCCYKVENAGWENHQGTETAPGLTQYFPSDRQGQLLAVPPELARILGTLVPNHDCTDPTHNHAAPEGDDTPPAERTGQYL